MYLLYAYLKYVNSSVNPLRFAPYDAELIVSVDLWVTVLADVKIGSPDNDDVTLSKIQLAGISSFYSTIC